MKIFVGAGDRRETDPDKLRVPVPEYLEVVAEDFLGFIKKFASNISRGGVFISTERPLAVGHSLAILFRLADDYTLIRGHGTVVWSRSDADAGGRDPGMGIRFDWLDEASQQLVNKLVSNFIREGGKPFKLDEGPLGRTGSMTGLQAPVRGAEPPPRSPGRPVADPPLAADLGASEAASELDLRPTLPGHPADLPDKDEDALQALSGLVPAARPTPGLGDAAAAPGMFEHLRPETRAKAPAKKSPRAPAVPPASDGGEFSLLPELLETDAGAGPGKPRSRSRDQGDFNMPDGLSLDLEAPNPFVDMSAGDQVDDHLEYSLELGAAGSSAEIRRPSAEPKSSLGDRDPLEALLRSGTITRPTRPPGDFRSLDPPTTSGAVEPPTPTPTRRPVFPPLAPPTDRDMPTAHHAWSPQFPDEPEPSPEPPPRLVDSRRMTPPPQPRMTTPPPPITRPVVQPAARNPQRSDSTSARIQLPEDLDEVVEHAQPQPRRVFTMLLSAVLSIALGAGLFVAGQRFIDRLRAGPEVVAATLEDQAEVLAVRAPIFIEMLQEGLTKPVVTARVVDGADILSLIENISFDSERERTVVTLWANGAFTPSTTAYRRIDGERPRELIKVLGVENAYSPATVEVRSPHVARLRIGFERGRQFDELLVVADLPAANVGLVQVDLDYGRLQLTFAKR